MNFYLSAVDDLIKSDLDNPSIGIILCREKDKFSVEYTLKDINKPIGVSSYEIAKYIPQNILEALPTEEELNLHIDVNWWYIIPKYAYSYTCKISKTII